MAVAQVEVANVFESDAKRVSRLIGLGVSEPEERVYRYLERKGLRFCVDFGWANCFEIAKRIKRKGLQNFLKWR